MSLHCDLKGRQKVFYLQFDRAASCCRAQQHDLAKTTLESFLQPWDQQRHELDQGQRISDCEYCWRDEREGRSSYRQLQAGHDANRIELYINNTCNHMCSYCSPKFSSEWQHSIQTQGPFRGISATNRHNQAVVPASVHAADWLAQIQHWITQQPDHSVELNLLGGEPLMQYRNLEFMLESVTRKISRLRITTNLNPPNNRFLHWLLDHLGHSKLIISVSLDASPAWNHIPRAGFDADRFQTNFDLIRSRDIGHVVLSVVSVLSVFDLANFLQWQDHNACKITFNSVTNPDCLDAALLPRWIRQTIWDQLPPNGQAEPVLREVLLSTKTAVDIKLIEQYNYLTQYFQRTQQDPTSFDNELFQAWWTWLEQNYRK